MPTNYEIAYSSIIPAFRRAVAREMSSHYHFRQAEIARRLGITQAAVSKYLSSGKATSSSKEVVKFIEASISRNHDAANGAMCRACQTGRKFDCAFMFKR